MKKIKTIIISCLLVVCLQTSAFAWGALEQGILWGVGGTIVTQQLLRPQVVHVHPAYQYNQSYFPYTRRYVEPYHAPRPIEPIYRETEAYDPACGCYKRVFVRIN